jgi:hypothetical protein
MRLAGMPHTRQPFTFLYSFAASNQAGRQGWMTSRRLRQRYRGEYRPECLGRRRKGILTGLCRLQRTRQGKVRQPQGGSCLVFLFLFLFRKARRTETGESEGEGERERRREAGREAKKERRRLQTRVVVRPSVRCLIDVFDLTFDRFLVFPFEP